MAAILLTVKHPVTNIFGHPNFVTLRDSVTEYPWRGDRRTAGFAGGVIFFLLKTAENEWSAAHNPSQSKLSIKRQGQGRDKR